jgi:hypothetical protein
VDGVEGDGVIVGAFFLGFQPKNFLK